MTDCETIVRQCCYKKRNFEGHIIIALVHWFLAGASQALSEHFQQDFVCVMMGMKALMPLLRAQIAQQNYQSSTSASASKPSRIQCMIAGQKLDCDRVTAAHLFPDYPERELYMLRPVSKTDHMQQDISVLA